MLDNISLENILFLDIETVPQSESFSNLSDEMKVLWEKKATYIRKENETTADAYRHAGIYAEFGKIICICAGYISGKNDKRTMRIKAFAGDDEAKLLRAFSEMLGKFFSGGNKYLCAHNGKEFDYPFIARRMLINGIKLPATLDTAGKKPWEVQHLDTMELWKFGDYKSYTSLNLLAAIFNVPTPKDDIDGSMVNEVYWKQRDLERIARYCRKDVLTVAQLVLRFKGESLLENENVEML
ncbi:MAG: 3'-5' exonuclease [Bacteroidia bacterium]|nr:3'-5' exonuclease [Bacteroidia bacterium]